MGYIREPKNVDFVVGPSVFTESTRQTIAQAIARYKKTGQKPVSVAITTQGSIKIASHIGRAKTNTKKSISSTKRKAKI
jgi:hypothetical protein